MFRPRKHGAPDGFGDEVRRRVAKQHARTKLWKLEATVRKASCRMDEAAMALVEVAPTTIRGAVALLNYFAETDDYQFPECNGESFACLVARNAARSLISRAV
jgi:hypothetical protein